MPVYFLKPGFHSHCRADGHLPTFRDGIACHRLSFVLPLLLARLGALCRPRPEVSRVILGSTGSGKSEGELVDLVRLADRRDCAVVLLDGHGPLARQAAGHWAYRGHEGRLVYEPLDATDRVLAWPLVPAIAAENPSRRRLAREEARDDLAQCLMAPRNLASLADRPYTKEWLDAALSLVLAQPSPEPLAALPHGFRVGSPDYERLLTGCDNPDVVAKFRDAERIRRRNPIQYDTLTGASRRLIDQVCGSEAIRLRSAGGPFDWLAALRDRMLIAFDGGGFRSREVKRTFFLLATMQVIHAVRRQFAETRTPLPVVLVLEEAGALGLVTPFVLLALQELRKAGLAVHVLSQSSLDFGDPAVFQAVLGNTPWQGFFQLLSPADQELGAKVLTNAAFDASAVHFRRERSVPENRVTGHCRGRLRLVLDPYYKPPSLQEQEFRTHLATLRVGERYVRDARGMRREQVRMLRPPHVPGGFDAFTSEVVDRVRQRPWYVAPASAGPDTALATPADAAARLRDASAG